jgi:protein gp37
LENRAQLSRLKHVQEMNAEIRFLSIEPMLGPVGVFDLTGIGWVIVGGESGPGFRSIQLNWIREVCDQCVDANVAFFFKQWGGFRPKSGGRKVDGRTWDEYPRSQNMASPCLL